MLQKCKCATCRWVFKSYVVSTGQVQELVDDLSIGSFIRINSRHRQQCGTSHSTLQNPLGEVRHPERAKTRSIVIHIQHVDGQFGCGEKSNLNEFEKQQIIIHR